MLLDFTCDIEQAKNFWDIRSNHLGEDFSLCFTEKRLEHFLLTERFTDSGQFDIGRTSRENTWWLLKVALIRCHIASSKRVVSNQQNLPSKSLVSLFKLTYFRSTENHIYLHTLEYVWSSLTTRYELNGCFEKLNSLKIWLTLIYKIFLWNLIILERITTNDVDKVTRKL